MFKLAKLNTVEWPVVIHIPQDGGVTTKSTIHVKFKVLDQDEQEKIVEAGGDLLKEAMVGWRGVADEDNKEVAFTPEQRDQMLKISYVRAALWGAWLEMQSGRAAARKN